jgi:hypothetical protein
MMMYDELQEMVDEAIARVGPFESGDAVLDIGAGDGALLTRYGDHRLFPRDERVPVLRVAYEADTTYQDMLHHHADLVVAATFPTHYAAVKGLEGRVKIITTVDIGEEMEKAAENPPHMLAPVFLTALAALLHDNGVWVAQLTGWPLRPFRTLVQGFGLEVVDAVPVRDGLRLTVQHTGHPVSEHVAQVLQGSHGVHA